MLTCRGSDLSNPVSMSTKQHNASALFALSEIPPNRRQIHTVGLVIALLLLAAILAIPYAHIPLHDTEPLLPIYATAILLNDVLTAVLLLALFSIQQSLALLVLSVGYFFVGLTVIPWLLTFPGMQEAFGLPNVDIQLTASIAALRRLVFPFCVLAYILLKNRRLPRPISQRFLRYAAIWAVGGTVLLATLLTLLVYLGAHHLPVFMRDAKTTTGLWIYVVLLSYALYALALIGLLMGRKTKLDLWLIVVTITLTIELFLLSSLSSGRLSVGWWLGRIYGFASASVVLIALLAEITSLYGRLLRSAYAERRIREERLAATQALLALISHEVNQPLTSIISNAGTGIRWLERNEPNIEEAAAALQRVKRDGHRAGEVISGIRAMYRKDAQERLPLDINQQIKQVLDHMRAEVQAGHCAMELSLGRDLPPVAGNPLQIQQVLSNMIKNALDAMQDVKGSLRLLSIQSSRSRDGQVMVSIEDTGGGVNPEDRERIFEPFFSTKADGMGMGLMFSRSIIEAHGGRLWLEDKMGIGAIFRFTLPTDPSA